MNFTDVNTIAEKLATHLNTLTDEQSQSLLKSVKVIHGSNGYTKIFDTLPDLTQFPVAVISLGKINYPTQYGGAVREVEYNVTLIEQPYGVVAAEETAQDHLEKLLDALTGNTAGQVLHLEGIPFVMGNVIKIDSFPPEYAVWNILLNAME